MTHYSLQNFLPETCFQNFACVFIYLLQMQDIRNPEGTQYSSLPQMAALRPRGQPADIRQQAGMMQHGQLTTINQSQLSAQLGLNMGGSNVPHNSPSPPGSKSATPSPSSSVHEDEGDDTSKVGPGYFSPSSTLRVRSASLSSKGETLMRSINLVPETYRLNGYKLYGWLVTLLSNISFQHSCRKYKSHLHLKNVFSMESKTK